MRKTAGPTIMTLKELSANYSIREVVEMLKNAKKYRADGLSLNVNDKDYVVNNETMQEAIDKHIIEQPKPIDANELFPFVNMEIRINGKTVHNDSIRR